MAQIIPPITSLPSDSNAAPSVEDIQDRLPSICVDYLSHDWSEEDVWASWRNMTRHKHEIANGVRLENASWRTWQKQRNKLKTISPETLNWLKDSDVTWLYGPLHTAAVEPVRPMKVSSTDDRLGIDRPNPNGPVSKKPILKHRTLSEMLTIPMPSSPILESTSRHDELENVDTESERPILLQSRSDTNIMTARTAPVTRQINMSNDAPTIPSKAVSPAVPNLDVQSPGSTADSAHSGNKKHISFNTFVEQCVALDEPRDTTQLDSSDDDEMLEMRSSSFSSSSRSSRPSLSRNSSTDSQHITIAKIAPTMLKVPNAPHGSDLQTIYAPPPEYQSPSASQSSSSGFDFPSPQVETHSGQWADHDEDEDDYGHGNFDYFGGPPNLSGKPSNQNTSSSQNTSSASTSQARAAPTVNQPPAQPKWRQKETPASPPNAEPSSVSSTSSSSSSINTALSPPQPSRGILKVRSPDTRTATLAEPSSPTQAYFNYTPSAATGIGGMRGSGGPYDYSASSVGPTGSPLASPTVGMGSAAAGNAGSEERGRGRTPSRDRGLNDRSTSRGTSAGSTGSFGSNSSVRSPSENSGSSKVQTPPQLDKVQEGKSWEPTGSQAGGSEEVAGSDYIPDRSNTPTPHSSPQISFRPIKDTSPASLPHTSTSSSSHNAPTDPSTTASPDLPRTDPPTSISPPPNHLARSVSNSSNASTTGGRATVAHVGTNAQSTLSHHQQRSNMRTRQNDEEDTASIYGRAATIASSAKDLLGALWYGNEGGQQQLGGVSASTSQGQSGAANRGTGGHRRGGSMG
ncbi:hypothetical protein IAU60_005906 [Kwoniella sp. DSM 27419]